MTSPLYVGLVHYPIYDKNFNVIATAITNYDLHDISRSAKTYGVKKYFIIHHIPGQLDMVHKIMDFWESPVGRNYNATAHRLSISSHPPVHRSGCRSSHHRRREETVTSHDGCADLCQYHFLQGFAAQAGRRRYADSPALWHGLWHDQRNDGKI